MADTNDKKAGRITQVIGSTLDAEFDEENLPPIYTALQTEVERKVRSWRSSSCIQAATRYFAFDSAIAERVARRAKGTTTVTIAITSRMLSPSMSG